MPETPLLYAVNASALSTDPREAAVLSRKIGFAGLLFDAYSTELTITDLSATGRREFRHILSAQDRQPVGFRVDVGLKGFGPGADVDRLLSQFDKVMEVAASMAAPLLCVETGPLPEAPVRPAVKPKITAEQAGLILIPTFAAPESDELPPPKQTVAEIAFQSQVDAALFELGALADRYKVTVALHSDLSSFAAIERALATAHCPWFGINLDPVSVLRDSFDMDEVFARLGPSIRHVRARDAVIGTDKRTKPASVGRGDTKWDHLLSNLEGAGYHSWITFDPTELADRAGAAVSGLKYLKLHES
jgi:sugar phosphate isomerase/epimerase